MSDNPVAVLEAVTDQLRAIHYTNPTPGERGRYVEAWTQVARELSYHLAQHGRDVEQLVAVREALTPSERALVSMPDSGNLELVLSHLATRALSWNRRRRMTQRGLVAADPRVLE